MLRVYQILASTFVLVGSAVSLSACGQQGALYLPTPTGRAQVTPSPTMPPASAASQAYQ